jgi:AcrR family transcriptional regulator
MEKILPPRKTKSTQAPVRQRLDPEERKRQIIEVATTELSKQGYWGFSVRQVAKELGLTGPAVLYHFKSKEDLMIAVLEHRDEIDIRHTSQALGVSYDEMWKEPVQYGLKEFCHVAMERNSQQIEIIRLYMILQAEALNKDHPAYEYYQRREERTISNMAKIAKHDNFPDPRKEAFDVFAAMDGLELRWLHHPDTIDLLKEWDIFAEGRWGRR